MALVNFPPIRSCHTFSLHATKIIVCATALFDAHLYDISVTDANVLSRLFPVTLVVRGFSQCVTQLRAHRIMTASIPRVILGIVEFGRRNLTADKQVSIAIYSHDYVC